MARFEPDSVVTQSILDRLIDTEPKTTSEAGMTRAQSVRALKGSLRRDLEWLLNTRRTPEEVSEEYPELARSLFNYGFPDFTTFSFANPKDRARLLRLLEAAVRVFEPRLDSVRVVPVETEENNLQRMVRFQIEGLLKMDPAPEQITFDTVLSLTSGEYQIKGERS
jgi:type VI secretion system protein ImpF